MGEKESTSFDVFGIRPVGAAVEACTKGAVDAAGAFLSRICLPAAEEFGLALRDRVSVWRAKNALKMLQKAEEKLNANPEAEKRHAHPRLVAATLENGSWVDEELVGEMWAGLLASSCTEDGKDESNLIFINILSQLVSTQVIILDHCCKSAKKAVSPGGWLYAEILDMTLEELIKLTGISDVHRLDRELDHLRALELIQSGFDPTSTLANVTPSALALQMYARCQGFSGSPIEFFDLHSPKNPAP
jgi:hypothetical protein